MDFNQYFENFQCVYDEALAKISDLRATAEELKDSMETIIDACDNIENEF